MPTRYVNSIKKAFDVLDILTLGDMDKKGMSLTELSEKSGIKPSTLHNILRTMKDCGYVEQNKKSLYTTGKRCAQIAVVNQLSAVQSMFLFVNDEMRGLAERTDSVVSFYVLHNGARINYACFRGDKNLKVDYTMLKKNNIYEYPSGKILVAYCSEREREKIIAKNGYPAGINTRREFMDYVKSIKSEGVLPQHTENGETSSYATAVFSNRRLWGSLGVSVPTDRCTEEKEKKLIEELVKSAEIISNYKEN
ncbi:MAG: helix-turn-helix domain-containing protein [Clostridia bacterium]|nr:helix-turn-helix domain-containing protein [Clostridia bacterium]